MVYKFRVAEPDVFHSTVKMHLSFLLDLNTDDCDCSFLYEKVRTCLGHRGRHNHVFANLGASGQREQLAKETLHPHQTDVFGGFHALWGIQRRHGWGKSNHGGSLSSEFWHSKLKFLGNPSWF